MKYMFFFLSKEAAQGQSKKGEKPYLLFLPIGQRKAQGGDQFQSKVVSVEQEFGTDCPFLIVIAVTKLFPEIQSIPLKCSSCKQNTVKVAERER